MCRVVVVAIHMTTNLSVRCVCIVDIDKYRKQNISLSRSRSSCNVFIWFISLYNNVISSYVDDNSLSCRKEEWNEEKKTSTTTAHILKMIISLPAPVNRSDGNRIFPFCFYFLVIIVMIFFFSQFILSLQIRQQKIITNISRIAFGDFQDVLFLK